jgi:hypothetical protein
LLGLKHRHAFFAKAVPEARAIHGYTQRELIVYQSVCDTIVTMTLKT